MCIRDRYSGFIRKMSVEIKGIPEVLNKLESVYGKQAMQAKSDRALNEASEFFIKALKKEFESFKDTGASIEEMTKSCLLYTSPSPRDMRRSRMPSSA
ncbi:hypothetical protein JMUB7530_27880 [Staphylococcus aureus]